MMKTTGVILPVVFLLALSGCVPMIHPYSEKNRLPELTDNMFTTEDGTSLPLHRWLPRAEPKAIVIALHGFNDYGRFFKHPGTYFSSQGIACYAYDQRGFGASPKRGQWAGISAYTHDLLSLVRLIKQQYPSHPIYLLGESMGGAVIISAMAQLVPPKVDGVILVAPALWARQAMPWYQTSLLWALAHTVPWLRLTGDGVGVQASDNIEMLRELGRDPLVIKKTKVEAIYGLTDLMDSAYRNADKLQGRTLILYGEKDEIIPKKPTYDFIKRFLKNGKKNKTVAVYQQGYHMLLRDLNAKIPSQDILTWIMQGETKLPSGADLHAGEALKQFL